MPSTGSKSVGPVANQSYEETNSINIAESTEPVKEDTRTGLESLYVIDTKSSGSEVNSEEINIICEQNEVNANSNSQFYESSDSKLDYAVKSDDNDTLSDVDDIKTDSASADSEDSALGSLPSDMTSDSADVASEAADAGSDMAVTVSDAADTLSDAADATSDAADTVSDVTDNMSEVADAFGDAIDTTSEADTGIDTADPRGAEIKTTIDVAEAVNYAVDGGSDLAEAEGEDDGQERGDGSDSGLGSETTEYLPCNSGLNMPNNTQENSEKSNKEIAGLQTEENVAVRGGQKKRPLRSSLKRKLEDETKGEPKAKKKKESVKFDNVTVFYFPRAQGFSCVPSQGGSTLGMEWEHSHTERFSLVEHAMEQRRLHRQLLQQLKNERHLLQGASFSSSDDSDTEEEASDVSESELDLDSYYFLQPVPTRQRRALLRSAGVKKIEAYEKNNCRDIRTSREFCGCACKGVCNPETCSCSLAGIKCQVDRLNFPCGCTRDGCSNTTGRIEFNPVRVRTHFIHTLMRIGLEKKNEATQEAAKRQWAVAHSHVASTSCTPNTTTYNSDPCGTDDGLLRDVNLSPRVEVESCVNAGSFNNVHCDMNNVPSNVQSSSMPDTSYSYRETNTTHNNISETIVMHMSDPSAHSQAGPYTPSMLQGKGPPYPMPNHIGFTNMSHSHSVQRFPCDLNYTYTQHNDTHHQHFKSLQSFSASSFEEFAQNSHMSMFSHYGHMYVPDYLHKPNTSDMHEHNTLQYHQMTQNHYEMYKNSPEMTGENKGEQQYANLMSMPYQTNNKVKAAQNDENWFSHNTLMGLENSEQTQDAPESAPAPPPASTPSDASTEATENFGELIKKTMVDSVSV